MSEPENRPAEELPGADAVPYALRSPLSALHSPSWTVGKLLNSTARLLAERGSEFPRLDAEVLLAHSLGCRRIELYTRYEQRASDELRSIVLAERARRERRAPLAELLLRTGRLP